MTRKEELEAKLEEYDREYDELWNAGYPTPVWWEKANELYKKIIPYSGEYHMIQDDYELHDIPDFGIYMRMKVTRNPLTALSIINKVGTTMRFIS